MLNSFAIILLFGFIFGAVFKKLHLPQLMGMLILGIVIGPFCLNLISDEMLLISADLRQIALIIILTRAGLNIELCDLKKLGRPAVLMCFVPAIFEIVGMVFLAPLFFDVTVLEATIIGCVTAAVSPAVIVPKMLKLNEETYGTNKAIPQLIMAGASVDDIFVIVLFTTFTNMAQNGKFDIKSITTIPITIIVGIAFGYIIGFVMSQIFKKIHLRDSSKVVLILSISMLILANEKTLQQYIPFSALLSIMSIGIVIKTVIPIVATRLSAKYSKLWIAAEILLFVLVGATVNIDYALNAGIKTIVLLILALIFRITGVLLSLIYTPLNTKERLFTALAYIPKATVQAAIGGIPLAMGLACGDTVLTVAVVAILFTAPIGAFLIDITYKKLLIKDEN